jgi:Copper type II ascorbate-dependent monooxygenase, C-terminal domain/Copper type II ascorbate-dependent monooxygenase, N-terminal domain
MGEHVDGVARRRRIRQVLVLGFVGALVLPIVAYAATRNRTATPPFARQVAPIVQAKCAGCHQLDGIAPFAFRTAGDLQRRRLAVMAVLEAKAMPPWPPSEGSPTYVGEDHRTLAETERSTLLAWLAAGARAPAASPIGAFKGQRQAARPGETVRTIAMPRPYTPSAQAGSTEDYRCFLVDPGLTADAFMTAARIEPGQRNLVHHVILFRVAPADVAAARKLDASSAAPGWGCFGGTGLPTDAQNGITSLDNSPWIAAWAPGSGADRLPDGVGIPLSAGMHVIMQVHYNLLNGRKADRSKALLTTVPASASLRPVETSLYPAPVELPCNPGESGPRCDRGAAIADGLRKYGAAGYVPLGLLYLCGKDIQSPPTGLTSTCDRPVSAATTIYGVAGHMHLLGKSIRVELNPGTPNAKLLLAIPDWDFHWQTVYQLAKPVQAAAGDVIRVTCTWDTSRRSTLPSKQAREPHYIVWGEGTTDEMCLGVLQVTRS